MKSIVLFLITICIMVSCSQCKKSDNGPNPLLVKRVKIGCDFTIPKSKMGLVKLKPHAAYEMKIPEQVFPVTINRHTSLVYLVFNGYSDSSYLWNYNGVLNVDSSGFTTNEQKRIMDTVSKDLSPFGIYVTNRKSDFDNANPKREQICVITKTWQWYSSVGGVSYIGSFTWGNIPAVPDFVFSERLNYNLVEVAKAIDHEIGHTLGLSHQAQYDTSCNLISEYRRGFIMGYSYVPHPIWGVGPNPYGCQNIQNDIQIINQTLSQ